MEKPQVYNLFSPVQSVFMILFLNLHIFELNAFLWFLSSLCLSLFLLLSVCLSPTSLKHSGSVRWTAFLYTSIKWNPVYTSSKNIYLKAFDHLLRLTIQLKHISLTDITNIDKMNVYLMLLIQTAILIFAPILIFLFCDFIAFVL